MRQRDYTSAKAKEALRSQYAVACNGYRDELLRMWELDGHYGYWGGDEVGSIYHYGESHSLSMGDIIYIVENGIDEDEVFAWEDYILDASEFGFPVPNLRSWHMGCPRTSDEVFVRLRSLKSDLLRAVDDEKSRLEDS